MASSKCNQTGFQPDSDVHISYEDQQKINRFARQNAKLEDFKEELRTKRNELKNLEDASDELIFADHEARLPYFTGEVFVHLSLEKTLTCLDEAKEQKQKEISELENKCADLKSIMDVLKKKLYSKFGNRINLEAEED